MAKRPTEGTGVGPPSSFAEGTPRDLYATSDIRFVMMEIGKLTAKVDRLLEDVGSHGTKLDEMNHRVSFVKGSLWVLGIVGTLIIGVSAFLQQGKLAIILDAIGKLNK